MKNRNLTNTLREITLNTIFYFFAVILYPYVLSAMSQLSDSDLANISNPLSLSMNPDHILGSDSDSSTDIDYSGVSSYLMNTVKRGFVLNPGSSEKHRKPLDAQTLGTLFYFGLLDNNDVQIVIQSDLIDPYTLKGKTSTIIAEEIQCPNTNTEQSQSISYRDGFKNSMNNPYTFTIKSGTTEMRDTFINNANSNIKPNSWVDIKSR